MARIILICGNFPVYDRPGRPSTRTEFVASHGINEETEERVIVSPEHPASLGAFYDTKLGEWVIDDER